MRWAVVVAKLVERSLPTPEVRGSNPVIGEIVYCQLNRKDENKKEAGNGPYFFKIKNKCVSGLKIHLLS